MLARSCALHICANKEIWIERTNERVYDRPKRRKKNEQRTATVYGIEEEEEYQDGNRKANERCTPFIKRPKEGKWMEKLVRDRKQNLHTMHNK